jgi:hypothetical protein
MKIKKLIAWAFLFSLYSAICSTIAYLCAEEYGGRFIYWMVLVEFALAGIPALFTLAILTVTEN